MGESRLGRVPYSAALPGRAGLPDQPEHGNDRAAHKGCANCAGAVRSVRQVGGSQRLPSVPDRESEAAPRHRLHHAAGVRRDQAEDDRFSLTASVETHPWSDTAAGAAGGLARQRVVSTRSNASSGWTGCNLTLSAWKAASSIKKLQPYSALRPRQRAFATRINCSG